MAIGYACLTIGVANTKLRTCRKKNATKDRLMELIEHNLSSLEKMIEYNSKQGITLFRISSDLIPFGSDLEVNSLNWTELFSEQFKRIGEKIRESNMRVSMHPGQYTVLNSPTKKVVERAVLDLEYHTKVLDALKVNQAHKIILHIGGVYNDKKKAVGRFVTAYKLLNDRVKRRLVIENDDRSYTSEDVLEISQKTGAPFVYDNLHNAINGSDHNKTDAEWIKKAAKTWSKEDGKPKTHYSQQRPQARLGSHSKTIRIDKFLEYYNEVKECDVDIMLEVKDKNLSAVKCLLATKENGNVSELEKEWARYKYLILEYSPSNYQNIRTMLKDKTDYPVVEFYRLIEEALVQEPNERVRLNAVDHVWGHLKNKVNEKEKGTYSNLYEKFLQQEINMKRMKTFLLKLAQRYEETYLLESLFFEGF